MNEKTQEVRMKLSPLAVVLITILIVTPVFAASESTEETDGGYDRGLQGHRGPPPEAIESCDGKTSGDECSFTDRRGDDLDGVCGIGLGGGTQIACRPKNHPGEPRRRPRPRDEKGEE